ncbi:MAG TPA: alpha/beta hydrolase, partial [Candidatus Limnocylindrales bacterium]
MPRAPDGLSQSGSGRRIDPERRHDLEPVSRPNDDRGRLDLRGRGDRLDQCLQARFETLDMRQGARPRNQDLALDSRHVRSIGQGLAMVHPGVHTAIATVIPISEATQMRQSDPFPSGSYAGLSADDLGQSDDRPPLVLLHGLTFDRRMWRPALTELARIDPGRRILSLDLPGHGESPKSGPYAMTAVVDRVHSAITAAHLEAPVIVGHSIAAGTATFYAAMHPNRGVIAVEGTFSVGPFAAMAQSLEPMLRGAAFADTWSRITANVFRLDEVSPDVRDLVVATSSPRQEIVLGYWQDLFERSAQELDAMVEMG